ncbi:alpha/beta hydrolase [Seleniivibrio woodruffii]|uniref:alpha/beta hydrolase n=1 Tax=Seleniivibrio woodruffii TaxID=1078050 RepID=UPI0026ECAE07|nr:alpha/beta hydrolase [Seleniivibrio woodruffii]
MKDIFLSGWCGFPALFGGFADKFEFLVPFYDDIDIEKLSGRNLVCWSTGANLALKAGRLDFENVVLVSPFIRFTDYTPERVLKLMIKKFRTAPETVIKDFLAACGCPGIVLPQIRDYSVLEKGLEYLLETGEGIRETMPPLTVIHGAQDGVVNVSSGVAVSERFSAYFVRADCGHFVPPEIISEYLI